MSIKPDPGKDKDREAAKTARKQAWKRETKKPDRQKAQADRIAAWEDATGRKWGER